MVTQHKKFIISLLIGTSFCVYGSGKINANDDAAPHNQPTTTAEQHNQAQIMTKKYLIDYIGYHMITTEESKAILDKIPDTQWPNFVDMCKTLQLINKDSGDTIFAIADRIHDAQWPDFISTCNEITPLVDLPSKSYAIRAVAKTDYEKWPDFSKTFIAVANGIDLASRGNALHQLATVPADQYKAIRDYYDLINPVPGSVVKNLTGYLWTGTDSNLIEALIDNEVLTILEKVTDNQLPDFFNTVKAIEYMDPFYIKWAIPLILSMPAENWQSFADVCNRLELRDDQSAIHDNSIIKALIKMPSAQWPSLVSLWQTIKRANPNLGAYEKRDIICQLLDINPAIYPALQEGMSAYPGFFRYVPIDGFGRYITENSVRDSTIQEIIAGLHKRYYKASSEAKNSAAQAGQ